MLPVTCTLRLTNDALSVEVAESIHHLNKETKIMRLILAQPFTVKIKSLTSEHDSQEASFQETYQAFLEESTDNIAKRDNISKLELFAVSKFRLHRPR